MLGHKTLGSALEPAKDLDAVFGDEAPSGGGGGGKARRKGFNKPGAAAAAVAPVPTADSETEDEAPTPAPTQTTAKAVTTAAPATIAIERMARVAGMVELALEQHQTAYTAAADDATAKAAADTTLITAVWSSIARDKDAAKAIPVLRLLCTVYEQVEDPRTEKAGILFMLKQIKDIELPPPAKDTAAPQGVSTLPQGTGTEDDRRAMIAALQMQGTASAGYRALDVSRSKVAGILKEAKDFEARRKHFMVRAREGKLVVGDFIWEVCTLFGTMEHVALALALYQKNTTDVLQRIAIWNGFILERMEKTVLDALVKEHEAALFNMPFPMFPNWPNVPKEFNTYNQYVLEALAVQAEDDEQPAGGGAEPRRRTKWTVPDVFKNGFKIAARDPSADPKERRVASAGNYYAMVETDGSGAQAVNLTDVSIGFDNVWKKVNDHEKRLGNMDARVRRVATQLEQVKDKILDQGLRSALDRAARKHSTTKKKKASGGGEVDYQDIDWEKVMSDREVTSKIRAGAIAAAAAAAEVDYHRLSTAAGNF